MVTPKHKEDNWRSATDEWKAPSYGTADGKTLRIFCGALPFTPLASPLTTMSEHLWCFSTELSVRTQRRTMAFALESSWRSGTPRLTTKVGEHLFICPQPPQVGSEAAPLSTYRGTH